MPEPSPKTKGAEKEHPMGDPRYKGIDRVLKRQQYQQDALIEVLTAAQEAFGYLTEESMVYIARQLKLPFSWVYGVATFYHFFSLIPKGRHQIHPGRSRRAEQALATSGTGMHTGPRCAG